MWSSHQEPTKIVLLTDFNSSFQLKNNGRILDNVRVTSIEKVEKGISRRGGLKMLFFIFPIHDELEITGTLPWIGTGGWE